MRGFASYCLVLALLGLSTGVYCQDVVLTSSNLPIVLIDTDGQEIPDEPKITAGMQIIDNGPGQRNSIADSPNGYDGFIGIEVRGWSSQYFYPKKQYGIETRDAVGENLNVSLLGMPQENDWVLYAPYGDKSLLRNVLVYQLARDMGWWAPRARFCELVLNGEYAGIYILMEKIKQDSDRINLEAPLLGDDECAFLAVMTPELQIEDGDETVTTTYSGRHWVIKYPRDEELTAARQDSIGRQIDELDAALHLGPDQAWRPLIDVASFADVILLNELTRNYDAFSASTFIYSDYGGVVHLGPVWDYNIALGNIDYPPEERDWETDGWSMDNKLWAEVLIDDAFFGAQLARDWSRRRLDVLDTDRLDAWLDEQIALLSEAQVRNFERWPILGEYVWPNHFVGDTWQEDAAWLRQWLHDRIDWLDGQWLQELQADPLINEINYNSADLFDPDDWVELFNPGLDTLDVSGWCFRDDDDEHAFFLPDETRLAPGDYLVLCRDMALFTATFPEVSPVIGEFDFGLSGGGEQLRLFDAGGLLVDHVDYDDEAPWPTTPDGTGPTLELLSPGLDNALVSSWSASEFHGTPGAANGVFQDEVWLLTFTASRVVGGVSLQWSVLGTGTNFILRARSGDDQWTVSWVAEGGGTFRALDTESERLHADTVYELHYQPSVGDEILLGTRTLSGLPATDARLVRVVPNPIFDEATITCALNFEMDLRIFIYDVAGRRVATVFDGRGTGSCDVFWAPRGLAAGLYFVCLETQAGREARKIVLVR